MKYVVINCWEREIYKVGEADTPNEATKIMKADFINEVLNNFSSDEENDEWDCGETEAWLNSCRGNYNWRIIEVE